MKEELIRYVDLLFAGAPHAKDIKEEILQNTLERYDDLVAQGKHPQAAYSLAISGIGDISEILGSAPVSDSITAPLPQTTQTQTGKPLWKKIIEAIAVCLYIMCPIPLVVLGDTLGLCGLLIIVAVATGMMMISSGKQKNTEPEEKPEVPQSELRKAINAALWTVGLCVYFILSFTTNAWAITWVIFPLNGTVKGLIMACLDLAEVK